MRGIRGLPGKRWAFQEHACTAGGRALQQQPSQTLFYLLLLGVLPLQVVFDMDGTMTETHIDFVDMRNRTGNQGCLPHRHLNVLQPSAQELCAEMETEPA